MSHLGHPVGSASLGCLQSRLLTMAVIAAFLGLMPDVGLIVGASAPQGGRLDPTGNIRGSIEIRRSLASTERRPSVSELGMPPRRDRPERMESVIYLENAPAGAFEQRPTGRARMTQRNETFLPYVLAVRGGTTVDFPNEDQTYHNVFSLSKVRRFDLGRYAAGKSKQVRFDQPGIVRVFCDIHSHMSAFILVFNHQFFDTTNADGRYNIPAVPAGKYTVNAWNDGEVRESRTVIVPEHGGTVEVDFVLR